MIRLPFPFCGVKDFAVFPDRSLMKFCRRDLESKDSLLVELSQRPDAF